MRLLTSMVPSSTAVYGCSGHQWPLLNSTCAFDWRPLAHFSIEKLGIGLGTRLSASSLAVSAVVGQAMVTPSILNPLCVSFKTISYSQTVTIILNQKMANEPTKSTQIE